MAIVIITTARMKIVIVIMIVRIILRIKIGNHVKL